MELLLIYLLELCHKQAQALVFAQAIIEEQAAAAADVDLFLAGLNNDMDLLDKEFDGMEAAFNS